MAVISTLLFAGPRAEELCNLLWRDVDLANGRIIIGRSKTQAGLREIDLLPVLRDTLATHKANAYRCDPDELVFPTATGGRRDRHNLRSRTLGLAIKRADELLAKRGQPSLPRGLTTHKLRHTFASILVATGEDPASVMAQLGHAHPAFTLRVYTHLMRRGKEERARLKALVQGEVTGVDDDRVAGGGGGRVMTAAIGIAILVVAGIWLFGGLLARWAGVLLVVAGSVGLASTGNANGLLLVALGIALWLVGHLLYRMRRGAWKSALAERLCLALLPQRSEDPWRS